ncbi:hypothetical protein DY000_02013279 [Brassica cretica]|uniref:Uncharacterized protein n=1 Tax=Brassica cretica TaxID=69181 RepID=A0ABQ7D8S5_BRACR|nr:hypothetical protein DY000_02013279 [Brassica cretica]
MDVVEDDSGLSLPVATSLKTTMEGFVVVDFDVLLAMDAIADTYSCMRSEFYRGKLKKVKRTHVWYWKINEGRLMIIVGESISPEIAKTVVVRVLGVKPEKEIRDRVWADRVDKEEGDEIACGGWHRLHHESDSSSPPKNKREERREKREAEKTKERNKEKKL